MAFPILELVITNELRILFGAGYTRRRELDPFGYTSGTPRFQAALLR
jgi:hypothetical protein